MNQQTINIPEGFELVQTSETTFEIKKKINLPKTWKEFCKTHIIEVGECFINGDSSIINMNRDVRLADSDRNLLPSKSDAEGILALMQLIQLRDCYNDGWKPNWEDIQNAKYTIYCAKNNIITGTFSTIRRTLCFKTEELRDRFFINFKNLIELAKDFI